ncbi:hypothetical protein ATCC90586_011394 [Pythium insidiosum]|nr:hypothetical protein ATCC90586_011394 [Pythium insidiosum]
MRTPAKPAAAPARVLSKKEQKKLEMDELESALAEFGIDAAAAAAKAEEPKEKVVEQPAGAANGESSSKKKKKGKKKPAASGKARTK